MPGFEVLLAGRTLGDRYRVDAVVGRGGMGAVFRATDLRLNRAVAVKVVTVEDDAEGRARARFLREAQAAARIRHPHVVGVYDFGTDATLGLDFLVMELLEGEDLAARLARDTVLPPAEAAAVFRQTAEGLAAGHRMGLVHRDVKPGNVFLVSGRGIHAMILDYGVAQMEMDDADTRTHLTRMGRQPLSPAYASPEQIRGDGALTPASDVFSLGVALYRAATGTAPFTPAELERLAAGDHVPLVPPLERVPELDPGMADALVRALHPDPGARPADADALLAVMAGMAPPAARPAFIPTPVSAAPEPHPGFVPTAVSAPAEPAPVRVEPVPPPVRRGPLMGLGGLALVVGGAAVYALRSGNDPAPAPAPADSATVAQVDTTAPDSTSLDTADTPVVIQQPEPRPQPVDSTSVVAPEPVPPPGDPVYDVSSIDEPPELRNRRDVIRILERNYPPVLRDAGVSGDVILTFIVDREGRVEPASIQAVNSADPQFVEAARRVAERMRFRPGRIRGQPVRSSVQVPISFRPE